MNLPDKRTGRGHFEHFWACMGAEALLQSIQSTHILAGNVIDAGKFKAHAQIELALAWLRTNEKRVYFSSPNGECRKQLPCDGLFEISLHSVRAGHLSRYLDANCRLVLPSDEQAGSDLREVVADHCGWFLCLKSTTGLPPRKQGRPGHIIALALVLRRYPDLITARQPRVWTPRVKAWLKDQPEVVSGAIEIPSSNSHDVLSTALDMAQSPEKLLLHGIE